MIDLTALSRRMDCESGDFGDGRLFVRWRSLPHGLHNTTCEMQIVEGDNESPPEELSEECFDLKRQLREAGHFFTIHFGDDGIVMSFYPYDDEGFPYESWIRDEDGNTAYFQNETEAVAALYVKVMPEAKDE